MKHFLGLSLVVLAAATARADDPPTVRDELQALQGTWQVEGWEENGKPLPAADLKKREVFFGGNVFIFRRGGKLHQAGAVQLDPAKKVPTVNLSVKEGQGRDGVMLGVYARTGDTLTLCFDPLGQARPEGVKPDAKAGFTVVTLKKPKPPADETLAIAGKYRSELTDQTGKVAVTEAVIERRGDAYLVTYTAKEKLLFVGTAIRKGDQLSMCWVSAGQAGVSVYKIEKVARGAKLTGEYTMLAGLGVIATEVLTPWVEPD